MTSTGASAQDLIGWRMRALGLWERIPGAEDAAGAEGVAAAEGATGAAPSAGSDAGGSARIRAVADRLLALQGQDWNAVRWALGLRAPGTVDADVLAAFDDGSLVRSWPMRGTIHVLPAEDLGWMQAATNHRVLPGAAKRREFLGLDDASLARMTDIAVDRLTGGNALGRDELAAAWIEAGIGDPERGLGPWRYHVIWWLSQNGIIVAGPTSGTGTDDEPGAGGTGAGAGAGAEPKFRLAAEWIRSPRELSGEEALAELALRFARGRGPILDRDLAWWTGLTVREARAGLAAAESTGSLERIEIEGARLWAEPELLAGPSGPPEGDAAGLPLLLPGFDEHLLGYTERGSVLDQANFERIVPGRNGMFRATVVDGGRVRGVWTRAPRAKRTVIQVEPFPRERMDLERLRPAAEAWGAFQGVEVEVVAAGAADA